MVRRISRFRQQDRLERITRLQSASAELESYKDFFSRQGELGPEGTWVARYGCGQKPLVKSDCPKGSGRANRYITN